LPPQGWRGSSLPSPRVTLAQVRRTIADLEKVNDVRFCMCCSNPFMFDEMHERAYCCHDGEWIEEPICVPCCDMIEGEDRITWLPFGECAMGGHKK